MELPFDDKSKCTEIAKLGDWLMDSLPKTTKRPEHFWDTNNLWRYCVYADGQYTIRRFRAMELLHQHRFEEPASDLARPIVEAAFRLDYLSDDEERLIDYARWQLLDCYHRILKPMSAFERITAEMKQECDDAMAEIEAILGDQFSDKRPGATWRYLDQLITFQSTVQNQDRLRKEIYTATGVTLSRGLHNTWLLPVPPKYGFDSGKIAFVLAMDRIAKLCIDKKLVNSKGTNYAKRIVGLCDADGWGG